MSLPLQVEARERLKELSPQERAAITNNVYAAGSSANHQRGNGVSQATRSKLLGQLSSRASRPTHASRMRSVTSRIRQDVQKDKDRLRYNTGINRESALRVVAKQKADAIGNQYTQLDYSTSSRPPAQRNKIPLRSDSKPGSSAGADTSSRPEEYDITSGSAGDYTYICNSCLDDRCYMQWLS